MCSVRICCGVVESEDSVLGCETASLADHLRRRFVLLGWMCINGVQSQRHSRPRPGSRETQSILGTLSGHSQGKKKKKTTTTTSRAKGAFSIFSAHRQRLSIWHHQSGHPVCSTALLAGVPSSGGFHISKSKSSVSTHQSCMCRRSKAQTSSGPQITLTVLHFFFSSPSKAVPCRLLE